MFSFAPPLLLLQFFVVLCSVTWHQLHNALLLWCDNAFLTSITLLTYFFCPSGVLVILLRYTVPRSRLPVVQLINIALLFFVLVCDWHLFKHPLPLLIVAMTLMHRSPRTLEALLRRVRRPVLSPLVMALSDRLPPSPTFVDELVWFPDTSLTVGTRAVVLSVCVWGWAIFVLHAWSASCSLTASTLPFSRHFAIATVASVVALCSDGPLSVYVEGGVSGVATALFPSRWAQWFQPLKPRRRSAPRGSDASEGDAWDASWDDDAPLHTTTHTHHGGNEGNSITPASSFCARNRRRGVPLPRTWTAAVVLLSFLTVFAVTGWHPHSATVTSPFGGAHKGGTAVAASADSVAFGTSAHRMQVLMTLLLRVDEAMRSHGVPYTVASGSMLGGGREGCLLEWDEDVDVDVPWVYIDSVVGSSTFQEILLRKTRTEDEADVMDLPSRGGVKELQRKVADRQHTHPGGVFIPPLNRVQHADHFAACGPLRPVVQPTSALWKLDKLWPHGSGWPRLSDIVGRMPSKWVVFDPCTGLLLDVFGVVPVVEGGRVPFSSLTPASPPHSRLSVGRDDGGVDVGGSRVGEEQGGGREGRGRSGATVSQDGRHHARADVGRGAQHGVVSDETATELGAAVASADEAVNDVMRPWCCPHAFTRGMRVDLPPIPPRLYDAHNESSHAAAAACETSSSPMRGTRSRSSGDGGAAGCAELSPCGKIDYNLPACRLSTSSAAVDVVAVQPTSAMPSSRVSKMAQWVKRAVWGEYGFGSRLPTRSAGTDVVRQKLQHAVGSVLYDERERVSLMRLPPDLKTSVFLGPGGSQASFETWMLLPFVVPRWYGDMLYPFGPRGAPLSARSRTHAHDGGAGGGVVGGGAYNATPTTRNFQHLVRHADGLLVCGYEIPRVNSVPGYLERDLLPSWTTPIIS